MVHHHFAVPQVEGASQKDSGHIVDRATFDQYITRFNACDVGAFEGYLCDDMKMLNGALTFTGIEGMKDHYVNKIWPYFREQLNVLRFIGNKDHVAVEMRTDFTALGDQAQTLFGPVEKNEQFTYHGVIMYDLRGGRFSTIQVAYNSFANIKPDGTRAELGLPH